MNIDPTRLLRHFGNSISEAPSGVKDKRRWTCPLHPDPDKSLSVSPPPGAVFRCDSPRCRFRGDAVSLVALARGLPVSEAIDLFRPGGELADCLLEPLRAEEVDAYIDTARSQAALKAYLAICRQALRRAPEKAGIRPGLSLSSTRLLHPDVGLFVGQDVPPCLSEFRKPAYRRSNLVLYPYTLDGEVTKIEVLDTTNPLFRHTVVVTHPHVGVFGESLTDGSTQLVAVERPEAAASLYASYAMGSTKIPPIVAFQGYPLPHSFDRTTTIHFLSAFDAPVSTELLLRTLSAPEIRKGRPPSMKAAHSQQKIADIPFQELMLLQMGGSRPLVSVQHIVASRLSDLIESGQEAEILELLAKEQVPQLVRSLVRDEAAAQIAAKRGFLGGRTSAGPEALIRLLDSARAAPSSDLSLANGRTFRRGQTSLETRSLRKGNETLCNVGLSVDTKIVDCNGCDIFVCSATHADDGVPVVQVRFSEKDLTPDRMQTAVSRAFSARGFSPYVAFYSVQGYAWRDIMGRLAEHCAVEREISELGLDSASNLNLPEVCVGADGRVSSQKRVFTLPEPVVRAYSAIPGGEAGAETSVEPFRLLLEQCDNLFVAAFTLGLMHVVYQMTYGIFRPATAKSRMMRHLFYVETEPGIWQAVFRQLSGLFSGCDFAPTVNYSDPEATLSEYSRLGCLPLIAYVPTSGPKFASALDSSGLDIIGLVDSSTAVMTNGKVSASYVMPMDEREVNYNVLGGRCIDGLRRAFVPFLVKFVREARLDAAYRASSMPCVAAYDEACRTMGVERLLPHDLVMNFFPGTGMTGVDILFDMLHRVLVDESEPRLCVVNGPPHPGCSFTRRGQHVFLTKDWALVSNAVFEILRNAFRGKPKFNEADLVSDMERRGMLHDWDSSGLAVDKSRGFLLKREVWEMKVVRPPINLDAEVKNGTLELGPVEPKQGPEDNTHACKRTSC